MNQKFSRWMAVAALAIVGATPMVQLPRISSVRADEVAPGGEVAAVDQLKTQAFAALRMGNFDTGNDLLGQAARRSADPQLAQMHAWTSQFDEQFKVCTDERHTAYDKSVADVQKLLVNGKDDAALDDANAAQSLSDDKKAFHDLPWVQSLIADGVKRAAGYEATDQWYKAMRLYSDLQAVEPASKTWKEKLKSVSRRWRLLATYGPDNTVKDVIADELKERDEVQALLVPTTQPATKPSEPMARNENFKVDWHDSVKGIKLDMLVNAMHDAFTEYYRDVTYRGLMTGGLNGIDALVNTHGLEKTFPGLADAGKRADFQKDLESWKTQVANATAENEEDLIGKMLSEDDDGLLAQIDRTVKIPREVVISEFTEASLATLDPFSNLIWPSDVAEFTKATQGEFSGIGVQILPEENGDLRVVRPLPDSPAERAGIHAFDVISEINGKSAKHITSDEAVKNITGPSGTTVNLTVRSPDGTTKQYNVRREKIKVESVEGYTRKGGSKWDYYIDPINKIAYLRITSFSGFTVKELHAAIDSMGDDVNGIIIDLRANPGGLLQAAIGVCDEFLKEGTIVSTHPDRETRNGPTLATARDDHNEFTKPLVVLINQYSASASEIVSGALKDDHRAILVGERSFGKGSVQQIFSLEGGDAILKLTTAHYYLPSGKCIHREETSTEWGVDPDVTVMMTPEQMANANIARQFTEMGPDYHPASTTITTPTTLPSEVINTTTTGPANHETFTIKGSTTEPTTQLAGATTKPAPKTLLEADPQLAAGLLVIRLELTGAHL